MKLGPLQACCPTCGSADVFYTCHTTCCFNHVCNDCRTTFELATRVIGRTEESLTSLGERDTSLPTAPCGSCEGWQVFQVEGGETIVCIACHSLLALEYEKVVSDRK